MAILAHYTAPGCRRQLTRDLCSAFVRTAPLKLRFAHFSATIGTTCPSVGVRDGGDGQSVEENYGCSEDE